MILNKYFWLYKRHILNGQTFPVAACVIDYLKEIYRTEVPFTQLEVCVNGAGISATPGS
jgi:hypothetical protein